MVSAMKEAAGKVVFDLERQTVRDLNQFLHGDLSGVDEVAVANPDGAHSIAVGVDAPLLRDRLLEVIRHWFSKSGDNWQPQVLENERRENARREGAAAEAKQIDL